METYELLQSYWWLLISILGAALVFLLFVQGGQTMLLKARNDLHRSMMVNSLGRKWELSFTTLVVFGGAFFASFPLFYSVSFGGAYWLWTLILLGFVLQAVSYEFRKKKGNIYGTRTFDTFLYINGILGCVLLGVAVGTFFFGAEFTVQKGRLLDTAAPAISTWAPTHGLEAIFCWKNLLLGFTILYLARMQAALYFINSINDNNNYKLQRKAVLINGGIFTLLFIVFMITLLTADGYQYSIHDGKETITMVPFKYLNNLIEMWWAMVLLLIGAALVLFAYGKTILCDNFKYGIWYSGIGSVLVVMVLFWIAGYNNTAYYPSLLDAASSLSINNSSSSYFTLSVMSWVTVIIPFVIAYIVYAWRCLNKEPITSDEMKSDDHKY